MTEIQGEESYEQRIYRLNELSGRFLTAWGQAHTTIEDIGLLPFDPQTHRFQAIDHHKTVSFAGRHEIDLDAYKGLLKYNLGESFKDESQKDIFIGSMAQEYPYEEGNGRSFTQVLAEDFLSQGLSVAANLGHPEDRLTDSPRLMATVALNLAEHYGLNYAKDLGLVAGAPLKVETYKDIPADEILSLTSDVYYTKTKSDNTELYRQRAGLTEQELDEISIFMNLGFGRLLMRDSRSKKVKDGEPIEHGHLIAFNPTATRADITRKAGGQPESIILPSADQNTGRLMSGFGVYWPVVVMGDQIKLGPFIRLEEPPHEYSRERRETYYLQRVEDAMDIVASIIDEILDNDGVAKYLRNTERGKIYNDYFLKGSAGGIGEKALRGFRTTAN